MRGLDWPYLSAFVLRCGLYFWLLFLLILLLGQGDRILWTPLYWFVMAGIGLALFIPYCFYIHWRFQRRLRDRDRSEWNSLTPGKRGDRAAEIGHGFKQMQ